VSEGEAVWHVRSALNVAALSCRGPASAAIVKRYNALLIDRKPLLARAYKAEANRFRSSAGPAWLSSLDVHMTRLYNFFAQPPVQQDFCGVAGQVAVEQSAMSDALFQAKAATLVARLEKPITDYYRAYESYRLELAEWNAHPELRTQERAVPHLPKPAKAVTAQRMVSIWRIQLGAFSGADAAKAAWDKARSRLPSLASYKPHYELVPDKRGLVRLQIGAESDQASALRLCATAAAGGFDCLALARKD
jgi:hypothetical protein